MSQQQTNGKQTFTTTKHITPYCNRFPPPKPFTIATISTTANGAVVSPPSTPSVTSPSPSCSPNNTVTSSPIASPNLSPTPYSNGGGSIPPPPPLIPKNFNHTPRPFSTNNNSVNHTVNNVNKNNNINNSIPPPPPRLPNEPRLIPPALKRAAPTASSVTTMTHPTIVTGQAKPAPLPSGAPSAAATATGVRMTSDGKVDPRDPQVRRLVYNMYRGMLDKKHEKANVMLESEPKAHVVEDAGIGARVQSMMRQQTELKDGTMNAGGPPPPPPPPPIPGVLPAIRLPTEVGPLKPKGPPAALAGAMMKEKKPFTYTPGGLDLSEINTQYRPQQNGGEGDPNALNGAPIQSRSFRVLQSVFDNDEPSTEGTVPRIGSPMRVEVPAASPGRTGVTRAPSQGLGTRAMTNGGTGNYVIVNGDTKPEGRSASPGPPRYISQNSNEEKELNNRFKSQVRVSIRDEDNPRYRGGSMNGTAGLKHDPQGPVHIPNIRQQQRQHQQYRPQQQQQQYHQAPTHSMGVTVPTGQQGGPSPSTQQKAPEPKKYMGGKIPSRSFRMLQALTGVEAEEQGAEDASECHEDPTHESQDVVPQADADNRNTPPSSSSSSSLPSGTGTRPVAPSTPVTSPPSSPSPFTPNKGFSRTNSVSSNQSSQRSPSPSLVAPSYTTVADSKVYRHVSPVIKINGPKGERVVNSALSNKAPPSTPKPWVTRPYSPQTIVRSPSPHTVPGKTNVIRSQSLETTDSSQVDSIAGLESPSRLLKILRQESQGSSGSGPPSPAPDTHRIYSGGHIPSRLFRHLQNEYQNSPGGSEEPDHPSPCDSKSPSPFDRHCNRYNRSFDSDATDIDNTSMASSSFGELDEYYRNGEGDHEVAHKDTPHTQLDVPRRKPRAAPGKVFRYLQMTYDNVDDSDSQYESQKSVDSVAAEEPQGFGNKSSKMPSPSFRYLQTQYQDNINSLNNNLSKEYVAPDAPLVEEEPTPYSGGRTPGKTFRMLENNITSHPSVLQARK